MTATVRMAIMNADEQKYETIKPAINAIATALQRVCLL